MLTVLSGFTLTTTHLRFVCEATTPLNLETEKYRAGQNLRGALGQVMMRTYCAGERDDPKHAATCPVHWLLAANEKPGEERRGYALVPPIRETPPEQVALHNLTQGDVPLEIPYKPGERFEFGITLFGHALKFLPYFVLAVPEMGRAGVGPGRGKFALKSVWAENPLTGNRECLLAEGDQLVRTPTLVMTHEQVSQYAEDILPGLIMHSMSITLRFMTPTRLIDQGRLAQAPTFAIFFARLLKRLDELNEQFGNGERRGMQAAQELQEIAQRVWLQSQDTRWIDVWSGSKQRGVATPLGGILGYATYSVRSSNDLVQLMPWVYWAQLVQVGKSTVKGNGVIAISR